MGRPRINDDAVRNRLLQSATEMLATRSPESVSIRALAAAAGTATAAVYTLFGSKEALIGEVRAGAVSGLFRDLSAVPATTDPVADIQALAVAYRRWALGSRHLYAVLFGGVQTFDPSGPVGAADPVRPLLEAIGRGLETGVFAGDPTAIALSLWAGLHGLVALELAGALDHATADRMFTPTVQATLRGWAAPNPLRRLGSAPAALTPSDQDALAPQSPGPRRQRPIRRQGSSPEWSSEPVDDRGEDDAGVSPCG